MKNIILLFTLFICALTDIVTYRIRNSVLLVSAVMLLLYDHFISSEGDIPSDLISAGVVLIILIPFYMMGIVAAGDAKLLALCAMYVGPASFCMVTAASAAAAAVIVFIISTVRREPFIKTRYPFAFALLIGAFPLWFQ